MTRDRHGDGDATPTPTDTERHGHADEATPRTCGTWPEVLRVARLLSKPNPATGDPR